MQIRLVDYQSTSAAGSDIDALWRAIKNQQSGLRENDLPDCDVPTWIGRVDGLDDFELGEWQSRNNSLAAMGLQRGDILDRLNELKIRFSSARLGVVIGSSTASIDRTETAYQQLDESGRLTPAYRQPLVHNPHAPGLFVAHRTGITGPAMTINTACSSSAKVFATGARWLRQGVVDAVLVGGVDTLCLSVMYGFHSLQLISQYPCRPYDQNRDGINLGEAAGFAILMRTQDCAQDSGINLTGFGESSDAHHMSHPHPDGLGAKLAMQSALVMSGLSSNKIDYINLHGTASRANDIVEGKVIESLFPRTTQVSSTKGWMGHTLGAAGITEALIAVEALRRNCIPGCLNMAQLDRQLELSIQAENLEKNMHHVMTNSFGFGGNNCSLVFSKAA